MSKATEWVARRHAVQAARPECWLDGVQRAFVGGDGQLVVQGAIPPGQVTVFVAWVWEIFGGDDIPQADLTRLGQVAWEAGARRPRPSEGDPRAVGLAASAVGDGVVRVGGG